MRSLIFALALGVICGASAGEGPRSAATQSMWDALLAGDHDAVVQAIGQGADLDSRGERGDTPLHLVVRRAHALDEIRFLLDRGADPNAVNQWRQTPLMVALFADTYEANPTTVRHRTEVASLLLERGASPRDPNVPAQNLLDRPLERGEGRLVLRLLEAGATLPEDALMRAMLPASIARDPDLLRLVIERSAPAQFRYQDERGFTPAHRALWGEAAFPVLEACIAAGVSPNVTADGQWALVHEAAWVGNLLAIEWLVARGARLDARTEDGRTALHVAAGVPNPRTMEWLLAKGLDPGQVDAAGRRPLDHFVRSRLYRLEPARAVALSQALEAPRPT